MTENYLSKVEPVYPTAYAVWKKYKFYIYNYLERIKYPDKEDGYSQSFFYIDYALKTWKPEKGKTFTSWLLWILKHKLFMYTNKNKNVVVRKDYRKKKEERTLNKVLEIVPLDTVAISEDDLLQVGEEDKTVEDNDYLIWRNSIVDKMVNRLEPRHKQLVKEYYGIENNNPQDGVVLGKKYGCTYQAIHSMLRTARQKLKKIIENYSKQEDIKIGEMLDYDA